MIYLSVLSLYLVFIFLVGAFTRKYLKSADDFYLGGKQVGAWVTALSFISAYFSSVLIIGGGGFGYKYGLATIWIGAINVLLGCSLCWIVLGERTRIMTHRFNSMTIPDFLGERFQYLPIRVYSSIIIILFMFVYNISILKAMGHILEILLNLPYFWGVIISGLVILVYVSLGGYLAVVWTGFIQAIIMIIGLLVLTIATLNKVGGFAAGVSRLAEISPGLVETPGVWGFWNLVSYILIVSFGTWGMPQLIVRFYSIKNLKVLKIGTVLATIAGSIALLPYINGALYRVLNPNLTNVDLAVPNLVKEVLTPYGGALFVAAVLAAGMSTFSAVLIITSTSMVRDLMQKSFFLKFSNNQVVSLNRLSSFLIGLISLLLALKPPALVLTLTAFSWAVIASTCLWPLFMGFFWKRATKEGVMASMVGGSLTSLLWIYLKPIKTVHGFIPGIIMGLILIILVSLLTKPLPDDLIKYAFAPFTKSSQKNY